MRKKFAGGRAALTSLVVMICIVGGFGPAGAQLPDLPLFPLAPRQSESPEVNVSLTPPDAQPGDKVTLAITVKLPAAGYTYSLTTKDRSGTRISIDQAAGLEAIDSEFQPDQPPKVERDPILEKTVEGMSPVPVGDLTPRQRKAMVSLQHQKSHLVIRVAAPLCR